MVLERPEMFASLMEGLWSDNALIRMRAADAVEKATRVERKLLWPFKSLLLELLAETEQQEVRWHLAVIAPRLSLSEQERRSVLLELYKYLADRSSLVRTFALQGMADLAADNPGVRGEVREVLRLSARTGTPAMRARSRKLLIDLEAAREE